MIKGPAGIMECRVKERGYNDGDHKWHPLYTKYSKMFNAVDFTYLEVRKDDKIYTACTDEYIETYKIEEIWQALTVIEGDSEDYIQKKVDLWA